MISSLISQPYYVMCHYFFFFFINMDVVTVHYLEHKGT